MPKKTRQAKVEAQLRRLQTMQAAPENVKQTNQTGTINLKNIPTDNPTPVASSRTQTVNYAYVISDLKKTAIFATVAIIFEIVLSLTASIWYANLISRLF